MPADDGVQHGSLGAEALIAAAAERGLRTKIGSFLFCRHGRTAGNATRSYQRAEEPLDQDGHTQAARAAALLAAGPGFARLYASDMARAWLTAGHVAAATGRAAIATPGLRERAFTALIGTSSAGLDWRLDPPGCETLSGFVERTLAAAEDALSMDAPPCLVAHGGTLLVLAGALGVDLPPAWRTNALPLLFNVAPDGSWQVAPLGD